MNAFSSLLRLWAHVSPKRRAQLVVLLPLMLAGAAAELITLGAVVPFLALLANPEKALAYPLLQQVFRGFGWQDSTHLLLPAAILFGCLAISAALVRLLLLWATNRLSYWLGYDLTVEVYRRTLYQPYPFHVARNTSESIAAFNRVQQVITGVLTPLLQGAVGSILGGAILATLFFLDPRIAGASAIVFSLSYALITQITRRRLQHNSLIISRAQSSRIQAVQEGLGGIRDIILDGSQGLHIDRFCTVEQPLVKAQITNLLIGGAPRFLIEALGMCVVAGLAFAMTQREGGLVAALPVLGALALGAQRLLPILQQIYVAAAQVTGNYHVTKDVIELLELPIQVEAQPVVEAKYLPFDRELVLQDVAFQYHEDGAAVLNGIHLRIVRGSCVGFVGKTGSGKSTLLDLVMGLLEPVGGTILVDGIALTNENRRSWQARIAHVPQAIFLSDATIAENIAFGVAPNSIDHERVRWAASQAQIADFIESERAAYHTIVGERGVRLSGGQRQRIGIARALYRKADILVLDEATSALDDATERAVMQSIQTLQGGLTVLIIAHRTSTLKQCDMVVKIEAGVIVDISRRESTHLSSAKQTISERLGQTC